MTVRSIGSATAIMAAGTVVSRATGFVRAAVMAATLGVALTADIFNVANTIPNSLYILVGGGVLNTVLVPQLVRAIRNDPDGGEAFAQRLSTAVVLVLLAASVLFVVAAPWILRVYVSSAYFEPARADQLDAMIAFTRYCVPQVFFYGVYLLLGQMLNARGSYGPMMWSPALNNIVAIAIFGGFLLVYGPLDPRSGVYTTAEQVWFGLGSTLGIAVQALVLLPVLHRTGLRLRFRRDLRGLGTAARMGGWTVLFVLVNQVTTIVVINLATAGSAASSGAAAGLTVFNSAFMLTQVPHSIVTVSLATALLPAMSRAAAAGDLGLVRRQLVGGMRSALAFVVPAAVLLIPLGLPLCGFVFGWGAAGSDSSRVALTLITMTPGMVFFCVQFLTLRGFYALEDTRTPFILQVLAVTPVYVTIAWGLTALGVYVPAAIGLGNTGAYLSATVTSSVVLGRRFGQRATRGVWQYVGRLLLAAVPAAAVAVALALALPALVGDSPSLAEAAAGRGTPLVSLAVLLLAGIPAGLVFIGLARLLRIEEVTELVGGVMRLVRRTVG